MVRVVVAHDYGSIEYACRLCQRIYPSFSIKAGLISDLEQRFKAFNLF